MFLKEQFREILLSSFHLNPKHKVLIAISGGIDSMCMLHLFSVSGYTFSVAHCNFSLRGLESDEDANFVKSNCEALGIPYHEKVFDTKGYAEKKRVGIQEAARNLRYAWFEELTQDHGYDFIATAHQLNDQSETLLMNMARGSGINGMKGIPMQNGKVIRPLLSFDRKDLLLYAEENHVEFRNDSSNEKDNYKRNYIRHHVIPAMEEVNSSFLKHMEDLSLHAKVASGFIRKSVDEFIQSFCFYKEGFFHISIADLNATLNPEFYLFYLLEEFNFNSSQVKAILLSVPGQSGKVFISHTHKLIKDRGYLIIEILKPDDHEILEIEDLPFSAQINGYDLGIDKVDFSSVEILKKSNEQFYLDLDKMTTRKLSLRSWKHGDQFMPDGMTHFKKLSDFFIDKKMSIPLKEKTILLLCDDEISAVLPYRVDERFKITEETKMMLRISVISNNG